MMPERRVRLGVLISGRGSNMEAVAKAAAHPGYPAQIAVVISNKAHAAGLATAAGMGLATAVLPHRAYPDRAAFDAALDALLRQHRVELVVLAGFMRVLTAGFVHRWAGRIVNIHPSLLPLYPGLDTHARALAAGDTEAGCTVHIVTEHLDDGPLLAQARVPVCPGDTADMLAARVLHEEHRIYPEAIATLAATLSGQTTG